MTFSRAQLFLLLALALLSSCAPAAPFAPRAVLVNNSQLRTEYDYVIIGGGTSGLVVANRLTENRNVTVLVIEYGVLGEQDGGTEVPGLPVPEKYFRNYQSVPQAGLDGRSSPVYSAAVVGGGTVVNGMFFNRGSAGDYDAWEALGNPGWGWAGLLPYFKKSETFTPPPEELLNQYPGIISSDLSPHGTNGPVGSSFSKYQYPIVEYFFKGWNAIGIATQPEPNAGDANGAFYSTLSLKAQNQSRSSADEAYYRPIAGVRDNFHLMYGQAVTKIILDNQTTATSVDFQPSNSTNSTGSTTTGTAKASREIILAAGAPHSPQILQLSGIGPKKLLSGLRIRTLVDLPGVGQNFQDQASMFMSYSYSNYPYPTPDWLNTNASWAADQLAIYYQNRTGPMTITYESGSIVAFLPLQNITNPQSIISSATTVNLTSLLPEDIDPSILNGYSFQSNLIIDLFNSSQATVQEVAFGGSDTVPIAMLKPLSRGNITINSTDPFAAPVFDYGTFSHPADIEIAVQALKKTREWMNSAPMQEVGATETFPGANITSDADIAASIRTFASSTWSHPSGSCSMMKKEFGGVVDSELRVYGVKGLRIVDASIMPMIPGSHISSTVYAVAEKAADIIKGTEGRKRHG